MLRTTATNTSCQASTQRQPSRRRPGAVWDRDALIPRACRAVGAAGHRGEALAPSLVPSVSGGSLLRTRHGRGCPRAATQPNALEDLQGERSQVRRRRSSLPCHLDVSD